MSKNKLDFNGLETLITMIKDFVVKKLNIEVERSDNKYLPFTGGIMNGSINWVNGSIGYKTTEHKSTNLCKQLIMTAGEVDEEWSSPNAKLALHIYNSENSAEDGGFVLQSSNGTNSYTLWGKPNGSLTWNNVNLVQPGIIQVYAGSSLPTGWLLCDGSAVSRTTYANLFSAIGTIYGAGNGSTTFNLPNLTDRFIQGNSTVGTVKNAGLPNITGQFNPYGEGSMTVNGCFITVSSTQYGWGTTTGRDSDNALIDFNASRSSSIYGSSSTVQPPALTMRYIIRY